MGSPNREPQEYRRNIIGIYLTFDYIPAILLGFTVWGSHESPFTFLIVLKCLLLRGFKDWDMGAFHTYVYHCGGPIIRTIVYWGLYRDPRI